MNSSIAILGRQPAIGLAELESLLGANNVHAIGNLAAMLNVDPGEVNFSRLGGSVKLGKVLRTFEKSDWNDIHGYLATTIPEHLQYLKSNKLTLGLSAYGLAVRPKKLQATGLEIKKAVKQAGYSMRLVPNNQPELSSAQVLHNKLIIRDNWELLFVREGHKIHMAQTVYVQDIDAYAARDQARPKRDARVGMLPPKLAQIIVNMSGVRPGYSLLDPFCGTGVILQEAMLIGCMAYGSDVQPRMIEYTTENLRWLGRQQHESITFTNPILEVADATSHTWQERFAAIASETYLGRPFAHKPKPEVLSEVMHDVDTIHHKFLQNIARQTKPGFRMCIAVPAWKIGTQFKRLPILDRLTDMGYTRVVFKNARNNDLIYHREGQFVGRELVTLIRK